MVQAASSRRARARYTARLENFMTQKVGFATERAGRDMAIVRRRMLIVSWTPLFIA